MAPKPLISPWIACRFFFLPSAPDWRSASSCISSIKAGFRTKWNPKAAGLSPFAGILLGAVGFSKRTSAITRLSIPIVRAPRFRRVARRACSRASTGRTDPKRMSQDQESCRVIDVRSAVTPSKQGGALVPTVARQPNLHDRPAKTALKLSHRIRQFLYHDIGALGIFHGGRRFDRHAGSAPTASSRP